MSRPAGGSASVNQPMRGDGCGAPRQDGRRQGIRASSPEDAAGCASGAAAAKAVERRAAIGSSAGRANRRALARTARIRFDAARQHQRVAQRGIALDVGLLGIDQQAAGRKARPASAAGRARSGRRRSPAAPRSRPGRASSRPGAAAARRGAGADADRRAGWSAPCRDRPALPSSRRASPAGWRVPTATASGDGRSTALRRRRARLRRAGPAPRAHGPCCARWRHRRASGAAARSRAASAAACSPSTVRQPAQVDLGGGLLGQELGGALQRLARLGEAAELQPRLAQQMQRLAGIGPRLDDLRQQRLGAGEVAGGGALHGVARQASGSGGRREPSAALRRNWNRSA